MTTQTTWQFYREGVLGPFSESEFRDATNQAMRYWGFDSGELGTASMIIEQLWAEIDRLRGKNRMTQTTKFENDHGAFDCGDMVSFRVENHISGCYNWDTHGQLRIRDGEWFIKTKQGEVTIGKGYDAYPNSIRGA